MIFSERLMVFTHCQETIKHQNDKLYTYLQILLRFQRHSPQIFLTAIKWTIHIWNFNMNRNRFLTIKTSTITYLLDLATFVTHILSLMNFYYTFSWHAVINIQPRLSIKLFTLCNNHTLNMTYLVMTLHWQMDMGLVITIHH